ncbi:MAG: RNA polymerase sigma factor [Aureispira sp.]|nr:RNA polymerase sigma factor [Aureispira sp.]
MSEEELIQHCIAEKRQYQELLYHRYADDMYSVCLTYAVDEDAACDILQDSFIKVFRNLHKFHFKGALKSWIRRIVVNTALDSCRSKKRSKENFESYQHTLDIEVDDILSIISAKDIIKLVNQLPTRASLILKLYAIEGFSHKEIAQQLDITESTSKSQLHRARNLLKKLMINLDGSK